MKLATLFAAATLAFASASIGQAAVVVFDNVTGFETGVPGATNGLTGSPPNYFMGDGYLLTPGTTNITGFDIFPANLSGVNFTGGIKMNIYVWGYVNLSGTVNASTPAFSNLLASYTFSYPGEIDSGFVYSFEGSGSPGIPLNVPLPISGTNVGITFNYQGSTDGGATFASYTNFMSLISEGAAPSAGGQDFDGYYRNANAEVNGNFTSSLRSLAGGLLFQSLSLRVYGTVAPQIPVANPQSVNVLKNISKNITLTGSVPPGDPITYAIVNNPTNGTLSGTPPNVTYTPNANYSGPDAFTFKVNDGIVDSTPALVSLNVSALAGLVIIPTWDSTILSDVNVASITNTIITAILTYETRYSEPVTVYIKFAEMGSGLGQSLTYYYTVNYSDYYNALAANSKTTNDTVVLAHLAGGSTDPVIGGSTIQGTSALLRALNFNTPPVGGIDSTISVNMSLINITRPPGNPSDYDLQTVVSHEIDEVLGSSSGVGGTPIRPADLFRFSGPGARNYTTSGDSAYFSIDGGNTLKVQYNQNASGDYGDWWSTGAHTPRVQDAFGTPGSDPDLGVELTVLDSVGWTLVSAIPLVVPQPVVHVSQSNTTMVLWWNSAVSAKYQLQYTTNLVHTNWVSVGGPITATTTSTTNVDASLTNPQRFYRVQVLPSGSVVFAPATMSQKPVQGPASIYKHVMHPRNESDSGSVQVQAPAQHPIQANSAAVQDSP